MALDEILRAQDRARECQHKEYKVSRVLDHARSSQTEISILMSTQLLLQATSGAMK